MGNINSTLKKTVPIFKEENVPVNFFITTFEINKSFDEIHKLSSAGSINLLFDEFNYLTSDSSQIEFVLEETSRILKSSSRQEYFGVQNLNSTNMDYKITVLPGDGIGPEVVDQALQVLEQATPMARDCGDAALQTAARRACRVAAGCGIDGRNLRPAREAPRGPEVHEHRAPVSLDDFHQNLEPAAALGFAPRDAGQRLGDDLGIDGTEVVYGQNPSLSQGVSGVKTRWSKHVMIQKALKTLETFSRLFTLLTL